MNKKNVKNKIIGAIELLIAVWLLAEGGWLYTKISGTNLLFIDSTLGKTATYYWVFLILGLIIGILGIITIKRENSVENCLEESKNSKEELKKVETESKDVEKEDITEEKISIQDSKEMNAVSKETMVCPACNATIEKGKKFCTSCGTKLGE